VNVVHPDCSVTRPIPISNHRPAVPEIDDIMNFAPYDTIDFKVYRSLGLNLKTKTKLFAGHHFYYRAMH